jgi:dihydrodipicolinate synthase/N-acetylneuraminate lyase
VDTEALERLLEFNLACGISGFFFIGSMGEWMVLRTAQKLRVLQEAVRIINGRAEVLAGVTAVGRGGILDAMEAYSETGVDAYALQLPGGWARPRDPVLFLHRLAESADKPLYLYYLPAFDGVELTKTQLAEILAHPGIKGIKNSSNQLKKRKELLLLKEQVEFLLFEGQEWNVDESLLLGYDGALVGMASLGARLFVRIARAAAAGDGAEAFALQRTMIHIFDGVYGGDLQTVWAGQKYALVKMGLLNHPYSLVPGQNEALDERARARIDACLDQYRQYLE